MSDKTVIVGGAGGTIDNPADSWLPGVWIKQSPINGDDWTPILSACSCNGFLIEEASGLEFIVCSNPDDPGTTKTVKQGGWFGVDSNYRAEFRFPKGMRMFYAKLLSQGQGNLVVVHIQ